MLDMIGGGQSAARALPSRRLSRAALRPPLKRAIDVAGAAALLFSLAPALVLVSLLLWAGGGPVLVARRRVVGRGGREFGQLAFRVPAEETNGRLRPTGLGRVLRRTGLDEVPLLLNVLRGDMSLVGPRPVARDELDRCYALFGGAAAYLSVRPGLVGPGRDGDLGARERVALDAAYARAPSLRADLAILARTLGGAALGRPAAR